MLRKIFNLETLGLYLVFTGGGALIGLFFGNPLLGAEIGFSICLGMMLVMAFFIFVIVWMISTFFDNIH